MQGLIAIHNLATEHRNTNDFRQRRILTSDLVTVGARKQAVERANKTAFQMQPTLVAANQLKERLFRAIDTNSYEIRDHDELARIVAELPTVKLTKSDLEETRLGKLINDIRKKASSLDKGLAKTLRGVVKAWRDMCEIKTVQQNGNSIVDRSPSSLISPSSLSNDTSRHFNGQNGYAPTVNGKENATNQHPALLRVRNQHTPLTSPSKDATYLNCSISPKLGTTISPGKKHNNLYSRSATASPRDSYAQLQQQSQLNGNFSNGRLGKGVSPQMRNSFKNIFNKNGATVSPANSTNMHASSNSSSRNCSPALAYTLSNTGSDGSNSNSVFSNGKIPRPDVHDEDSIGSNSNFSNHFSRFGNGLDSESRAMLNSESSKSKAGRKRKIEPDTLRENLNSVLNSTGGRKAQSTQEILQNVMKINPLSCQSSPALNGVTVAKKPRISNGNLAFLDENAVDNFDAVRRSPGMNGFSSHLEDIEPNNEDSDDSLSNQLPYNFEKEDRSVDEELAALYARLPKISDDDLDAVRGIKFEKDTDNEVAIVEDTVDSKPKPVHNYRPADASMDNPSDDEYETFQYLEEYEEEELEEVEVTDDEYHSGQEDGPGDDDKKPSVMDEVANDAKTEQNEGTDNVDSAEETGALLPTEPQIIYQAPISLEPVAWNSDSGIVYTEEERLSDLELLNQKSFINPFEFEAPFLSGLIETDPPVNDKKDTEAKTEDAESIKMESDDDIKNEPITPMSEDIKLESDKSESIVSPQDNDDYDDDEDDDEDDDDGAAGDNETETDDLLPNNKLIEEVILPPRHTKKVMKKVLKKKFRPRLVRSNIKKNVLQKFANEQWPGMNGNYDDEGNWCSYGDMSYVKPLMEGQEIVKKDELDELFNTDFVVLPYTNCSW